TSLRGECGAAWRARGVRARARLEEAAVVKKRAALLVLALVAAGCASPRDAGQEHRDDDAASFDRDGVRERPLDRRLARGRVRLPSHADAPFHVEDEISGLAIDVRLVGASPAAAIEDAAAVRYPGAAPGGGDVVHWPLASGTEDLVALPATP